MCIHLAELDRRLCIYSSIFPLRRLARLFVHSSGKRLSRLRFVSLWRWQTGHLALPQSSGCFFRLRPGSSVCFQPSFLNMLRISLTRWVILFCVRRMRSDRSMPASPLRSSPYQSRPCLSCSAAPVPSRPDHSLPAMPCPSDPRHTMPATPIPAMPLLQPFQHRSDLGDDSGGLGHRCVFLDKSPRIFAHHVQHFVSP